MTLSAISRPPIDALLDATSATIAAPNWLHLWYNQIALKIPGTVATA
jgi:hypothetical protein